MAIKVNFHETITTKHHVANCYKTIKLQHNQATICNSENLNQPEINKVHNVSLFPSYLQPEFYNNLNVTKVPQKKIVGYAVTINNHHGNMDAFFNAEYKKSFRANILRFVNRFETCFNAKYKLFYGDITETEYLFLMNTLKSMLTNRFDQRNDSNKVLLQWDAYLKTTHRLIIEKKASLFVIYQNDKPVHVCLNHHYNNILFVSVPSYDIDYAKFALGNISLYKLLEWSVNNNYQMMDMAQGYLEYKRRWSNVIYDFEHHIVSSKQQASHRLSASLEILKLNFKNYLKSKNIDEFISNIKNKIRKNTSEFKELNYTLEPVDTENISILTALKIDNPEIDIIRKAINEFLYTHKEHLNKLSVYKLKTSNEYLLKGKQTTQKLRTF